MDEKIPALPLDKRRRFLGLFIPLFNVSIFILAAYDALILLVSGVALTSIDLIFSVSAVCVSFMLGLYLIRRTPIYTSRYSMKGDGIMLTRLFKRSISIPFKSILRVEVFIRQPGGKEKDEAVQYAKTTMATLRLRGTKFMDYTNSEEIIALLVTDKRVYLISPSDPKALLKRLKSLDSNLSSRLIEMASKRKRSK